MFRKCIKRFAKDEQYEISLNGTTYDFSVNHIKVKKEDILNIHEYLMIKNNIKEFLGLLKKFIGLLTSIVHASSHTKCVSLNHQKWTTQPTFINLHPNEYSQGLGYYSFALYVLIMSRTHFRVNPHSIVA